jgi:N-acyl amino acid synthase of PEP-CTERM/exosortase system
MAESAVERYFDFVRIQMQDSMWPAVQRLRYDVYCVEMKFLQAAEYPDGLEGDEFDARSSHYAAVDQEKQVIATLRLVRDDGGGFPLERHTSALYPEFYELPRAHTVEISRLILAKHYRRRANDTRYGTDVGPDPKAAGNNPTHPAQRRSKYPLILFGLFRCMFEESLNNGLTHWIAAMEPWLQDFLGRFGFRFVPVGDAVQYYGEVIPYSASVQQIFETVSNMHPDVLKVMFGGESA